MLGELIDSFQNNEDNILNVINEFDFNKYKKSDQFLEKVGFLTNPHLRPSEYTLIPNSSHIAIVERNGWTCSLAKLSEPNKIGYNISGVTIIVNMDEDNDITLDIYEAAGCGNSDEKKASMCKALLKQQKFLSPNKCAIFSNNDEIYSISSKNNYELILLFQQTPSQNYFHSFDLNTGDYLFSAYSSLESAGLHYISDLFKCYIFENILDVLKDDFQKNDLVTASEKLFYNSKTPSLSRWLSIQSTQKICQQTAFDMMLTLQDSD
jgi:hypothetical protein